MLAGAPPLDPTRDRILRANPARFLDIVPIKKRCPDLLPSVVSVVERSMVYKEYFAAGTEPVDSCELHSGHRGFLGVLASAVGVSNKKPDPVNPDNAGIALPSRDLSAAHTGSAQTPEASQPAPQKRGFWSRLFGGGKDNKQGESKQNNKSDPPARP